MPEQLAFPLPHLEARGREAFFVSAANALAVRQIEAWRSWPQARLVLLGPEGAGKSHLAQIWADLAGASVVSAVSIAEPGVPTLADRPVAVEDADRIAGDRAAETRLFHLHNLVLANGHSLLVTARRPPRDWGLTLPDLASRVAAAPVATLDAPDDALLNAVLVKLFADRQIAPPPRLVEFCLKRMDRSFAAARRLVVALDERSMATGRPIGTQLAAEVLEAEARD